MNWSVRSTFAGNPPVVIPSPVSSSDGDISVCGLPVREETRLSVLGHTSEDPIDTVIQHHPQRVHEKHSSRLRPPLLWSYRGTLASWWCRWNALKAIQGQSLLQCFENRFQIDIFRILFAISPCRAAFEGWLHTVSSSRHHTAYPGRHSFQLVSWTDTQLSKKW